MFRGSIELLLSYRFTTLPYSLAIILYRRPYCVCLPRGTYVEISNNVLASRKEISIAPE